MKFVLFALFLALGFAPTHVAVAQTEETTPAPAIEAATPAEPVEESVVAGVARGVTEATTEVGTAVRGGGQAVAEQGSSLWHDVLVPMYQRFASALPGVVKALLVLAGFWILATLAGAAVSRVLKLTNLDNRAVKDWGMGQVAGGSLEKAAGQIVKWIILLFGFVAFFQSLNLPMVAGPLQNVVDKIVGTVPNLLNAAFILLAYWVVASLLKVGITKGLGALKFDSRASKYLPTREIKGEQVGPSALFGRLVFYVVLLFGIPPFLQALGQEALVAPLQDMLGKVLAFLPNIVAALIIVFVGNIVASIVKEVTVNFLAAAGLDNAASRVSIGKVTGTRKLSDICGTIVYFFVIVPIIISAVEALGLDAISQPVKATLEKILGAVPGMLGAAIVIIAGYAIAKAVRAIVETFLSGIGADNIPERIGLHVRSPRDGGMALSLVVSQIVMVVILILTAQQALAVVGFTQLAGLLDQLVRYLPNIAVAVIILLASLGIGNFVSGLVRRTTDGAGQTILVGSIAKYAILFLGASMALEQLGVGREIVVTAVTAVLGGAALALGIAFGLGGRDRAKTFIDKNLP